MDEHARLAIRLTALALSVFILLLTGCSGGNIQPTVPETDADLSGSTWLTQGHNILGVYNLELNMQSLEINPIPGRTLCKHWNVAPIIVPHYPGALSAQITDVDIENNIYYIEITLTNPLTLPGYNVKGIILLDGTGEYDLLNPDSYTGLWADIISPFRYFAKDVEKMKFISMAAHVVDFDIYISDDHHPIFNIPFAIDAHWPGVQKDPLWINNIEVDDETSTVTIECDIIDYQDDIELAWADTYNFNGGDTEFVNTSGNHWEASFDSSLAFNGLHKVLLNAKSVGSDVLLHHYCDVTVEGNTEGILEGEVFNSITLGPAEGTRLTITNAIPEGPSPVPMVIGTTGEYSCILQAGHYSVEVETYNSTTTYDYIDTTYDINVTAGSHIVVDFGLCPAYLDDDDEQICCINGQIFDETTGLPVEGAYLSITGGEQTGGIFESRITDEHGHYVFWKVPCNDYTGAPISEFTITCVADGFDIAERTMVPFAWNKNTPQENFDLTPGIQNVLWTETFEPSKGPEDWTFEQIECTCMWQIYENEEIYNLNVTMVASDGGMIVELPPGDFTNGRVWSPREGDSALWYGEDDDGSFIHDWSNNSPGGTSICGHAGKAISPEIDIIGESEASIAWKQIWEIEGVDPSIQYDYLKVYIRDVSIGEWFLFDHSNPKVEPIPDLGSANARHPFTSGGFNIPATWQANYFDLSDLDDPDTSPVEHMDFTDKVIQFRFEFGTIDSLYNGFRGWMVDEVVICSV